MQNSGQYYGAYTDREDPGYHLVGWQASEDADSRVELIKVPVLELKGRRLVIEYEILTDDLKDEAAQALIVDALLNGFYRHSYEPDADKILFVNRQTGARRLASFVSGVLR
jgi:hypothetical protein